MINTKRDSIIYPNLRNFFRESGQAILNTFHLRKSISPQTWEFSRPLILWLHVQFLCPTFVALCQTKMNKYLKVPAIGYVMFFVETQVSGVQSLP